MFAVRESCRFARRMRAIDVGLALIVGAAGSFGHLAAAADAVLPAAVAAIGLALVALAPSRA